MTDPDFDVCQRVKYFDVQSLYWKKYPYKIEIKIPPNIKNLFDDPGSIRSAKHFSRMAFRKTLERGISENCKRHVTSRTLSYYFENAPDAMRFIDKNKADISKVYRPVAGQIAAILSNPYPNDVKIVTRSNLFWDRYRYCVIFKYLKDDECEKVDEDVALIFSKKNIRRFLYIFNGNRRRLYLRDESDLMYVVTCQRHNISNIEKVLLKDEINADPTPNS